MADISSLQVPRDELTVPSDEMEIVSDTGRQADNYMSDIEIDFEEDQRLADLEDSMVEDPEETRNDDDAMQDDEVFDTNGVEEDIVLEDGYDVGHHGHEDIDLPEIVIDETEPDHNLVQNDGIGTATEADSADVVFTYIAETAGSLAPPQVALDEPIVVNFSEVDGAQDDTQQAVPSQNVSEDIIGVSHEHEALGDSVEVVAPEENQIVDAAQSHIQNTEDQSADPKEDGENTELANQATAEHQVIEESEDQSHNQSEPSQTQPIILVYEGTEYYLFECGDASRDYFIEDRNKIDFYLKDILQECKQLLGDDLREDHYISLTVESLHMHFSESTHEASSVTLYEILEIYFLLCHNDGIANPEPLRITLTKIPKLSIYLDKLRVLANSGFGISSLDPVSLSSTEFPTESHRHEEHPVDKDDGDVDEPEGDDQTGVDKPKNSTGDESEETSRAAAAADGEAGDEFANGNLAEPHQNYSVAPEESSDQNTPSNVPDEEQHDTDEPDLPQGEQHDVQNGENASLELNQNQQSESVDSSATLEANEEDSKPALLTKEPNHSENQDEGYGDDDNYVIFDGEDAPIEETHGAHGVAKHDLEGEEIEEAFDIPDDDSEETPTEADFEEHYDDDGPAEDNIHFDDQYGNSAEEIDEQVDQYGDSNDLGDRADDENTFEHEEVVPDIPSSERDFEEEKPEFAEFDFGGDDPENEADNTAELDQFLSFADHQGDDAAAEETSPTDLTNNPNENEVVPDSKRKRPLSENGESVEPRTSPKRSRRKR